MEGHKEVSVAMNWMTSQPQIFQDQESTTTDFSPTIFNQSSSWLKSLGLKSLGLNCPAILYHNRMMTVKHGVLYLFVGPFSGLILAPKFKHYVPETGRLYYIKRVKR